MSATAWHWVNPAIGIPKAARLLTPDGTLALWWNAHDTDTADPHWAPVRRVYEDVAPHLARLAPLTPDRPDYDPCAELLASGLFTAPPGMTTEYDAGPGAPDLLMVWVTQAAAGATGSKTFGGFGGHWASALVAVGP